MIKLICWQTDSTAQLARLCGWFFSDILSVSDLLILHSVQALLHFPLLRLDNSKLILLQVIHFISSSGEFKSLN